MHLSQRDKLAGGSLAYRTFFRQARRAVVATPSVPVVLAHGSFKIELRGSPTHKELRTSAEAY